MPDTIKVIIEFNKAEMPKVIESFINYLEDNMNCSGSEDLTFFNNQIDRARKGNPELIELGVYLGVRAGFTASNGNVLTHFIDD